MKTDKELLDVTSPGDWQALFDPESIDVLLSEHMLEHLSERECKIALAQCYKYLKPGALFRVAVPDGYRRDPAYVAEASPPKDGHQVLFNVHSLTNVLERAGFETTPLEYFDVHERFHCHPWNTEDGFIRRSAGNDRQEAFRYGDLFYTSIIVDARKN
ncbi:MAG TPA: methyltransferase domain-containing protein [Pyrinomonadaceae bacterium]|nr:methyltransferase domain-containing protein [Pyrinomonadaceae bacterium]